MTHELARRLRAGTARWVAHRVGSTERGRLERLMRRPRARRAALATIFWAMPKAVRRRALEREGAVIEWHLTGRPDGSHDVRQLVIGEGAANVATGQSRTPDLAITLDAVDLVLLATGNAAGSNLYVEGRIEIDGDPWLAARMPQLFARPA